MQLQTRSEGHPKSIAPSSPWNLLLMQAISGPLMVGLPLALLTPPCVLMRHCQKETNPNLDVIVLAVLSRFFVCSVLEMLKTTHAQE